MSTSLVPSAERKSRPPSLKKAPSAKRKALSTGLMTHRDVHEHRCRCGWPFRGPQSRSRRINKSTKCLIVGLTDVTLRGTTPDVGHLRLPCLLPMRGKRHGGMNRECPFRREANGMAQATSRLIGDTVPTIDAILVSSPK